MPTHYKGAAAEVLALDTYIKVRRVANTIDSQTTRQLKKVGLTPPQFAVIEALFHLGPMHACSLTDKLLVSGGNVTVVVNNLVQRGLIERHADDEDRRYFTLSLSSAGRRLIHKYFPEHAHFIKNIMSSLSKQELTELGRLSKKLGRALAAGLSQSDSLQPSNNKTKNVEKKQNDS